MEVYGSRVRTLGILDVLQLQRSVQVLRFCLQVLHAHEHLVLVGRSSRALTLVGVNLRQALWRLKAGHFTVYHFLAVRVIGKRVSGMVEAV